MLERYISLGCRPRPPTRPRPRSVEQRDSPTLFFEYENEDDDEDEKQSNRHIRHLPIESLPSTSPAGATSSERGEGKSLEFNYSNEGVIDGVIPLRFSGIGPIYCGTAGKKFARSLIRHSIDGQ